MELAGNAVFVAAQLNRARPVSWLLDTASARSSIDPDAARETGFSPPSQALLALPGVEIADAHLDVKSFDSLGAWYGHPVRGVLGVDLLTHLVAEIDYARLSSELYDQNSFGSAGRAEKLDIRWISGLPAVRARLRLAGRTLDGDFLLNTAGSVGIVVSHGFLASHRMLPFAGKTTPTALIEAAGETTVPLTRGEWLELGSVRISQPLVAIAPEENPSGAAGWIGGEILRKFRLVLDFSASRIFLEPNRDFIFPLAADASGITLVAAGPGSNVFEIHDVADNSPAAQAGLAPGDRIVAVDGAPVSDLSLDQVRDWLRQAGETRDLTIRRLGRELKLQIKLRSLL
ncbi:MAG TPA: PDZ domain-containing protein [Candidatus Acidoferrales bacterium]|nr:PDZ domain-containing protein [Candidatus Acidoferrales bacterium]